MVSFKKIFILLRLQNLLIIAATMYLIRYALISPILGVLPFVALGNDVPEAMLLKLPWYDFLVLVISTLSITAAGYVINDYFDIKTDRVNRGKVLVGTAIPRRKAMMYHNILNIIGIAGGFYVSYKIGYFWLGIVFLLVTGLLYFYSATYKRQLLIGNIIVSLLTAAIPFMVAVFEIPPVYRFYLPLTENMPSLKVIFYWVGGFSLFAFLLALAREIIKDIEDFEGDRAYGSNTLPVALGIRGAKIVAATVISGCISLFIAAWYFKLNDIITLIYILIALVVPLVFALWYLIKGKEQLHFRKASQFIKAAMLSGICYSLLVLFILRGDLLF